MTFSLHFNRNHRLFHEFPAFFHYFLFFLLQQNADIVQQQLPNSVWDPKNSPKLSLGAPKSSQTQFGSPKELPNSVWEPKMAPKLSLGAQNH